MFDRKAFFAALRSRGSGVFGTSLSSSQVEGVDAILDEGIRRRTPLRHMAYVLATAYHETGGRMQPIRENLNYSVSGLLKTFGRHRISVADARKYGRSGPRKADQVAIANIIYGGEWGRKHLGNTEPGDGWRFRGGGLPQNTGRRNFTILGLADKPELVTDLKTSVRMMFDAMAQGVFTGKRLDDYTDYLSMRRIINGTDKAEKIALEAEAFERALRDSEWGLWPLAAPTIAAGPSKPGQSMSYNLPPDVRIVTVGAGGGGGGGGGGKPADKPVGAREPVPAPAAPAKPAKGILAAILGLIASIWKGKRP